MLQLLQTVAAPWQHGKLQTDLGLGSRRRPARSIVTSRVGFSSLFPYSLQTLLLGAAPFMTSLAVDKFLVARLSLSPSLSHECLQLATLHCRQISWLKDALACLLQTGTHIHASYSCSYSHKSHSLYLFLSLVQLASFIKIDRKS